MKAAVAVIAVLLAALPALASPRDVIELWPRDGGEQASPPVLDLTGELPPAVARRVREILGRSYRTAWTVLRFDRLPDALRIAVERSDPILGPEDAAAVRAAAGEGSLRLETAAAASGRPGEPLAVRRERVTRAYPRRELESAEGAVALWPGAGAVRAGLVASARVVPAAGRRLRVEYDVRVADDPAMEIEAAAGGDVDRLSVPVAEARGAVWLAPGEAAPILFERPDGSGTLVLLRLDGPEEELPVLEEMAGGWVVSAGGHLAGAPPRSLGWDPPWRSPWLEIDEETEHREDWEGVWDEMLAAADAALGDWWSLPAGVAAGVLEPRERIVLRSILAQGAAIRGRRGALEVRRPGWGRVRLPLSPGEAFGFFRGDVRTVWSGTDVTSGCNDCSAAVATTGIAIEGLVGAGRAGADGTIDIDLTGRAVVATEWRDTAMKRIVAGYRAIEDVPVRVPLVTDDVLLVRATLPGPAGELPGDVGISFSPEPLAGAPGAVSVPAEIGEEVVPRPRWPVGGRAWIVPEEVRGDLVARVRPIPFRVNGQPLPVRPGETGVVEIVRRRSFLTAWESGGWCGMRIRYPLPSAQVEQVWDVSPGPAPRFEGIRVRLVPGAGEGEEIDVEAEVGKAPEAAVRFDTGDGEADLVRYESLRISVEGLPLGGGGTIARGAGLSLEVRRTDREAGLGAHRTLIVRTPAGECELHAAGSATLEAGGRTSLPVDLELYASNHETGEASTAFATVPDGIRLELRDAEDGVWIVRLDAVGPAATWPYDLRAAVVPRRAGTGRRTLGVERRVLRRTFLVEDGGRLRAESPEGSALPFAVEAGGGR